MKRHIVGSFSRDSWTAHGKRWMDAVQLYKGDADVIVMHPVPQPGSDARFIEYNDDLFGSLAKMDGIFLYVAPNVRLQTEPMAIFEAASDRFAVVERRDSAHGQQPFNGQHPVYETYWAAPSDLLDMLYRITKMSSATGCKPPHFETNHVSYFSEYFPLFRHMMPATEYMPVYDAQVDGDYHVDPKTLTRLTAVGLDEPETKKAGVMGGIVKSGKPLLTSKPKDRKIRDLPVHKEDV